MPEYNSIEHLKKTESVLVWRQTDCFRRSWLTVVAPHAGTIEPITGDIAIAIAGTEHNLFVFEGLRRNDPSRMSLHVKSHLYFDPALDGLLAGCDTAISIHGAKSTSERITYMGGLNQSLSEAIWTALDYAGFQAEAGTVENGYAGENPDNLVNRAEWHGAQLEITRAEREALRDNRTRWDLYINAVRKGIEQYRYIFLEQLRNCEIKS